MVFALWPSHLAEWAWESLAGEADWGIYGGSGDCRSGQICRSSAQHGTQQSSHSHTEMAARDGNCKTRYQKFSIDSLPEAISNEQTKRKGCPCYRNTASTLVLYRICQPNWLPKVGILHLPQGLIPSWLKKVKEKMSSVVKSIQFSYKHTKKCIPGKLLLLITLRRKFRA